MIEEAPPEKGEGSASRHTSEALDIITPCQPRQRSADEDIGSSAAQVNTDSGISGKNLEVLVARGRLAEAKRWFAHRGWALLPQDERGDRILRWGADQAYLASPANPERGVLRWCRKWERLTDAKLAEIVAYTKTSNKRWSADQSATVLEITVRDRSTLHLRFIGASDDPEYKTRLEEKLAKAAARARRYRAAHSTGKRGRPALPPEDRIARSAARVRKYRAKHSTGGKPGRPALQMSPEEKGTRRLAQEAERKRRARASAKNASRKNPSRHIKNIGSVTEISVTDLMRTRPVPPRPIEVMSVFDPHMIPTPPGRTAIIPALIGGERHKRAAAEIRNGGFAGAAPPTHLERALARALVLQRQQEQESRGMI